MSTSHFACPLCDQEAKAVMVRREITVGRRRVQVDDEFMECEACQEAFYTPTQSNQLEERAKAQASRDQNLLSPSDIKRIRKALSFTQPEFEELIGVGAKTCARWESGKVRPNVSTDRLIRLLASNRKNVETLAGINGVALKDSCFVPEQAAAAHSFYSEGAPLFPAFHELATHITLAGSSETHAPDRRDIQAANELLQRERFPGTQPVVGERLEAAQIFNSEFPPSSARRRHHDH